MMKLEDSRDQIEVNDSFERFQESELLSPVQSTLPGEPPNEQGSPITHFISQRYSNDNIFQNQNHEIGNLIKKAELGNKKLNLFFHGT